MNYYVGVDPQPSLLAFQIITEDNNVVAWFQVLLARKESSFSTAGDWETYIASQCLFSIQTVEDHISKHTGTTKPKIHFVCEQQRGRVKTIPEACLVTAAKNKGWEVYIPHPATWKKLVNFPKPEGGGNKANKDIAMRLKEDKLKEFCKTRGIVPPKVTHHLCDAALLAEYGMKKAMVSNTEEDTEKDNVEQR